MIKNGKALLEAAPFISMLDHKERQHGVSYGLAEAGYDIRIKQDIKFTSALYPTGRVHKIYLDGQFYSEGRFVIASAIEEFAMPTDLVGVVHDKSTWARKGLSVFNTVIEPGWFGELTLELVYHGSDTLHIPAGCGIAQVIFHTLEESATYSGKYQGQSGGPTPARFE